MRGCQPEAKTTAAGTIGRRVALVRHPPALVAAGICYGRLDLELAAGWEAAITAIVARLADLRPTGLWTSPARRCCVVADGIAAAIGAPARTDPRLLEMDFGAWEGLAWDDVPRADLDAWAAAPEAFAAPGGESAASLVARVKDFWRSTALPPDAIIVSHGGPLKILAALLAGRPVDVLAPAPALGSVEIVTIPNRPPAG